MLESMEKGKLAQQGKSAKDILHSSPLMVVVFYVIAGAAWLSVTDLLAHTLFTNGTSYFWAQFLKGMLYIASTGLLVYWLARRAYRSIQIELVEERLELSERILSAVLGSIGEAVLLVDPSGRKIVNCNAAAEQVFGYNREELKGKQTRILHIDREHFEQFGRDSEAQLEEGGVFRTEYKMKRKDGSVFDTANTVSATHDDLGWKAGVVSIIRDISDRKAAEQRIRESLNEKQVMLKEIHHRVKNNLSVITSLLNLQADRIEASPEAHAALDHSRSRIRSMALIHEQLYGSEDFVHVNMRRFAEKMVRSLGAGKYTPAASEPGAMRGPPDVRFHYEFEDVHLTVNWAIPCSLILNELVSNALLHAFSNRSQGRVNIGMNALDDNRYELKIQDDGRGLPGFGDQKKLTEIDPQGLGFRIVEALLKQINGEMHVQSSGDQGTTIRIVFREEDPAAAP